MNSPTQTQPFAPMSRRRMLATVSGGFGAMVASALGADLRTGTPQPHHSPRAKSVIFLYLGGGLSHLDSFDYKPFLAQHHGEVASLGASTFRQVGAPRFVKPLWDFKQRGQSGLWVSELFPHLATCADDLTVIRSMQAKFPEHSQANFYFHSGMGIAGFPSLGCWTTYGLGSEGRNLPDFVVLKGIGALNGDRNYLSGYLPSKYDPSIWNMGGKQVLADLSPAKDSHQQRKLELLRHFSDRLSARRGGPDSDIEGSLQAMEKAFVMQTSVPAVTAIQGETEATRQLYGMDHSDKVIADFGRTCLTARRLVERGVRFVEMSMPIGSPGNWDQHADIVKAHARNAVIVDRGVAGLIQDLKSRSLLEDTLVIIGTEFGRTPFAENFDSKNIGRDHNPNGFSIVLAGGGVKAGFAYGQTDEVGANAVENPVSIHDLHATILHLLGLNHERLTYRFGGRDMRLTDVHGHVIREIIA
jgi:hypothetical protein